MISVKINILTKSKIDYDINRYVNLILKVIPENHIVGLSEINFVDKYQDTVLFEKKCTAYYYTVNGKWIIDINIPNVLNNNIPKYYFEYYQEIASLSLSEILGHEIGHHVARFLKSDIKDREEYAKKYAEACYWNYFESRKKIILLSYLLGEINFLDYTKEQRLSFRNSRKKLASSFKKVKQKNKSTISYP